MARQSLPGPGSIEHPALFPGDDAALYGASLFETIAANAGELPLLDRHWRRLLGSTAAFGWPAPTRDAFESALRSAMDRTQAQVLRYTWLKLGGLWSSAPPKFAERVFVRKATPPPAAMRLALAGAPLPSEDPMRAHKHGARLVYQLEAERARTLGCDDVLLFDQKKRLLETSRANLFLQIDGEWLTPPLRLGLLPGIARALWLESGQAREAELDLDALQRASAAVVCNAVWGRIPVLAIDARCF